MLERNGRIETYLERTGLELDARPNIRPPAALLVVEATPFVRSLQIHIPGTVTLAVDNVWRQTLEELRQPFEVSAKLVEVLMPPHPVGEAFVAGPPIPDGQMVGAVDTAALELQLRDAWPNQVEHIHHKQQLRTERILGDTEPRHRKGNLERSPFLHEMQCLPVVLSVATGTRFAFRGFPQRDVPRRGKLFALRHKALRPTIAVEGAHVSTL